LLVLKPRKKEFRPKGSVAIAPGHDTVGFQIGSNAPFRLLHAQMAMNHRAPVDAHFLEQLRLL